MLKPPSSEPERPTTLWASGIPLFRLGGLLLLIAFAVIYALTLDTGLQPQELHGGDLITHQYAQVQARPGNAPGYPIYTMGGWLWFHGWHAALQLAGQSFPNPIPILSSYSTLWALLALFLLYVTLGELLGELRYRWHGTLFCLLLTAFFGVTYFFWYYATTTEQYSSAVAQTLAIFYLYLCWEKFPARRDLLYLLAFLCGLSLAHMLTVALIVPPLVAVVLWRDPSLLRSARANIISILAAALPLLSYIYVYMRGALNPNWWGHGYWPTAQAWFWDFVSTAQGRDELAWAFEPGRPFLGNGFPEVIWQELSLPLLSLGILGISRLPRRHAALLYSTLLLYLLFCWLYRFGNWFQVILPAYPLILLGIVPFYAATQRTTTAARLARYLFLLAMVISLLWRAEESLPAADSRYREQDTALDRAAVLLDQPLPQDARLFAAVDDALAINYLTAIWGIRPDIKPISSQDANEIIGKGGQLFSTLDATPTLLAELTVTPTLDGFSPDWVSLRLEPVAGAEHNLNDPIYVVSQELHLLDYIASPSPPGSPLLPPVEHALDVLLTWYLPTGVWPPGLAISLRPMLQGAPMLDPQTGQPIQQDRPRPLFGLWRDTPTAASGIMPLVVHDPYRLLQPATLQQADGLLLILYTQDEDGFTNIAEITMPLPGH
jgi:hypothetical protein